MHKNIKGDVILTGVFAYDKVLHSWYTAPDIPTATKSRRVLVSKVFQPNGKNRANEKIVKQDLYDRRGLCELSNDHNSDCS